MKKPKENSTDSGAARSSGKAKSGPGKLSGSHEQRELVADMCRLLGRRSGAAIPPRPIPEVDGSTIGLESRGKRKAAPPSPASEALPNLSPRMKQTLERLLAGDSEKQIAAHLGVSRHTVHVYVKAIYRGFGVCSRGELLARFVRPVSFKPAEKSPSLK